MAVRGVRWRAPGTSSTDACRQAAAGAARNPSESGSGPLMGKRSRKRSLPPAAEREPAVEPAPARTAPPPTPTRRARLEEAPKAPWSPFPLVELCILLGLVLVVWGFVGGGDRRGALLGCGFALLSLAALELSIRELFAGYRSHSTLLAGSAAVLAVLPLFFLTELPQEILLGVGVAVFAACFAVLRRAFKRRTGGIAFRA